MSTCLKFELEIEREFASFKKSKDQTYSRYVQIQGRTNIFRFNKNKIKCLYKKKR